MNVWLENWKIKDPWIFFTVGGLVVLYLLYMMIARRKVPRGGEPEL